MIGLMMKMNKVEVIENYLDEMFKDPKCELKYHNDYELLIAIVLSAQTTDKRVNKVSRILFSKYPSLKELSEAKIEDIENIIKKIGTYHKKAVFVHEIALKLLDKKDLNDRAFLESLSGVGRKTANVFLAEIYNEPTIAVDTHVSRVSKRLGFCNVEDDVLTIERKLMKLIPKERWNRTHHQLVLFGRYYCKALKPECENCKLKDICKK